MRVIAKFSDSEHYYDADRVFINKEENSVKIIKYMNATVDEQGKVKPVKVTETYFGVIGTYEEGEVIIKPAKGVTNVTLQLG